MKKYGNSVLILIFILALALSGCGGGKSNSNDNNNNNNESDVDTSGAGKSSTYTADAIQFNMHYVPAVSSFPTNAYDSDIGSVSAAYVIAETEATYQLWSTVFDWATDPTATDGVVGHGQYVIPNKGSIGSKNSGDPSQPVTMISWRDIIVWCNALTEYFNAQKKGTNYQCVYYKDSTYTEPIRDTSDVKIDSPYIYASTPANIDMAQCTANGFRLPTIIEWELAARYITDKGNDHILKSQGEYYPATYASGADATYDMTSGGKDYDGDGHVHYTGDVAVYNDGATSSTAIVKSKSPNKLGLYDMNGNVSEFCFDLATYDLTRTTRGGCWKSSNSFVRVLPPATVSENPDSTLNTLGFRFVKTM